MAKKKGKGKKGKQAKEASSNGELTAAQQLTIKIGEVDLVRRQIEILNSELLRLRTEKKELLEKNRCLEDRLMAKVEETDSLRREMLRAYKCKTSEYEEKLEEQKKEHLSGISDIKQELERKSAETATLQETVKSREGDLATSQRKLESMTKHFGDMLQTTLDKLSEKVEVQADEWDDSGLETFKQRLLEGMNP